MPVKIRLARHGKKGYAFYHIVVADSRAPRDGKFIEKIGTYNPNTNPATIDLNFDKALEWLQKGAQPTDTCRAILSYKGVMYKKHLPAADAKFEKWMSEKAAKKSAKTQKLTGEKEKSEKARLAAEKEANEKKAKAIEAKRAEAAAAAAAQTEEAEAPAEGEAPAAE